MFSMDVFYKFSKIAANSTKLNYEAKMNYANWFAKVMGFLFQGLTKSILKKQMQALKLLAEGQK